MDEPTNPHQFSYDPETGVCYRTLDFMGHPGYRVGDDGSVWSCRKHPGQTGRLLLTNIWHRLKPYRANPFGHLRVSLNNRELYRVHRLVLTAFVGPCPEGLEGCHNDSNPTNNYLANLRWDTPSANRRDAVRHGSLGKLTLDQVAAIRDEYATGSATFRGLGRKYKVGGTAIRKIVVGRTWSCV